MRSERTSGTNDHRVSISSSLEKAVAAQAKKGTEAAQYRRAAMEYSSGRGADCERPPRQLDDQG